MRLKQLLESRGTVVDDITALKDIEKHYSNALRFAEKNKFVFRGVGEESSGDFVLVKPSQSVRVSKNTHNLYTLVIDGSSKWSKYPNRSKSIICTTDRSNTGAYGKTYIVLPKDGYKFGVCPTYDMWASFENTLGSTMGYGVNLSDFNDEVAELLDDMGMDYDIHSQLKTSSDLKALVKEMDKAFDESGISENRFDWLKGYQGSFLKLFEWILDPNHNGFMLSNDIGKISALTEREVWTDSDSYLVSWDWWKEQ